VDNNDFAELFRSFAATVVDAIDEVSQFSKGHTANVARLCVDFATHLGAAFPIGHLYHFDANRIEALRMAAMLHDIGKFATPRHILDKQTRLGERIEPIRYRFAIYALQNPDNAANSAAALALVEEINTISWLTEEHLEKIRGLTDLHYIKDDKPAPLLDEQDMECLQIRWGTLTEAERSKMKEHPAITGALLANVKFCNIYQNIPKIARDHHELLDGSGYPLALRDKQITIETRILTIMDIYEALTSPDRPHKKAMPPTQALRVLTNMAAEGKLDRELVTLFATHSTT